MKRIFCFSIISMLFIVFLTGCSEDDNGQLAGTYNKIIANGESSYPTRITLEYKKPDYKVSLIIGNGNPRNLGLIKKKAGFLVKSDNLEKKIFEIKNGGSELVSLYTSSPSRYEKQSK